MDRGIEDVLPTTETRRPLELVPAPVAEEEQTPQSGDSITSLFVDILTGNAVVLPTTMTVSYPGPRSMSPEQFRRESTGVWEEVRDPSGLAGSIHIELTMTGSATMFRREMEGSWEILRTQGGQAIVDTVWRCPIGQIDDCANHRWGEMRAAEHALMRSDHYEEIARSFVLAGAAMEVTIERSVAVAAALAQAAQVGADTPEGTDTPVNRLERRAAARMARQGKPFKRADMHQGTD